MDARARALRDRYFELRAQSQSDARDALWAELDALELPALIQLAGLGLSPCPSARFRQLRFVDAKHLAPELRQHFARPCPELPELLGAFVDPHELGFHCFENLVCLDRMFEGIGKRPLRLRDFDELAAGIWSLRGRPTRKLAASLDALDGLGLYAAPQNADQRGGQRFIFHAAGLARALTAALGWALPDELRAGFVGVNPVFRCNRFDPGDAPFEAHRDAPYADRARGHYSRYTLLLQLRAGRGQGVLRFGDRLRLDRLDAHQLLIFDQRHIHAGAPFAEGPKIFLRSELIYAHAEGELQHLPEVGGRFAKAIYLDTEQLFAPELAAATHAAYERATAAHWQSRAPEPEPLFRKRYRGWTFLTNGYDYWLAEDAGLSLPEAAALALLDQLNAKLGGRPFREQCERDPLEFEGAGLPSHAWLASQLAASVPAERPFASLDPETWFPAPERPEPYMDFPRSPDFTLEPFPDDWDATRHERVVACYRRAQDYAKARLLDAPVVALGTELFLAPDRFVIEGDAIHVLSRERLEPLHFAGAVFYNRWDFIETEFWAEGWHPLVPPIYFQRLGGLLHLRFDLFRNDWMVSARSEPTPVPVIETEHIDPDNTGWLYAAARDYEGNAEDLREQLERE